MRTVTYGVACSLDGFIAAADGALDWLHFSKDAQEAMAAYWRSIDTILMGRRTWQIAAAQRGTSRRKRAKRPPKSPVSTYVFSRTLSPGDVDGAELVRDSVGDFVRALKGAPGKGICVMGGGILASSLLDAGVIDVVELNIHPILLGAGAPLFRDAGRRIPLALTSSRTIDGGCVLANYRVQS